MGMETRLSIKYSGSSVDAGYMDVYQASKNMIAFSEFVVVASRVTFGDKVEVKAEVAGFGKGSFLTDLVFKVASESAPIFASFSPSELLTVINQSFDLWKHLKGDVAKDIRKEGQLIEVTNNDGEITQIKIETLNLVMNDKAAESISKFVKEPLQDEGVDSFEIKHNNESTAFVDKSESGYFGSVVASEIATDNTMQMVLIIEAPVFKDGNKWRFSDGQNSFYADIVDEDFLLSVDEGAQFGKGDLLKVDLRIMQERSGLKITTERTIKRVIEHKKKQQINQGEII